jgi:hypothetical protein
VTGRCTPDRYSGVRGGMTSSTHRDLAAWREAMSLVEIVYRACVRFPSMRTRARPQAEPPHRLWPKPVRVRVSSRLKQIHPPRRCAWRRLRAQPQVRENALDQLDDLQLTPRATDSRAVNWGVYEFVPAMKCNRDGRLMGRLLPMTIPVSRHFGVRLRSGSATGWTRPKAVVPIGEDLSLKRLALARVQSAAFCSDIGASQLHPSIPASATAP